MDVNLGAEEDRNRNKNKNKNLSAAPDGTIRATIEMRRASGLIIAEKRAQHAGSATVGLACFQFVSDEKTIAKELLRGCYRIYTAPGE